MRPLSRCITQHPERWSASIKVHLMLLDIMGLNAIRKLPSSTKIPLTNFSLMPAILYLGETSLMLYNWIKIIKMQWPWEWWNISLSDPFQTSSFLALRSSSLWGWTNDEGVVNQRGPWVQQRPRTSDFSRLCPATNHVTLGQVLTLGHVTLPS